MTGRDDEDHDLFIRMDANVTNLVAWFKDHIKDDTEQFERLDKRTARLEKFMWATFAIVGAIEFVSKIIH